MSQPKTDFIRKLSRYFDSLPFSLVGKTLCVGLSGGADSVSLLLGLIEIEDKYGFSVFACHFNHMIRGAEADRDEDFCKELCDRLNRKIYCGRDNVPEYARLHKVGIEQAARECRYSFFDRILKKDNIDFCVTAHNKNDDAETLLFNLIRGSGSNGATAIAPYGDSILRPLLQIERAEIEAFLSDIGQDFVTDSTNKSNEYTRNFIRNVIIPEMQRINPSAVDALSRYAESARADRAYFDKVVSQNRDNDLRLLDIAVRTRVIMQKFYDFSKLRLNHDFVTIIDKALFCDIRSCIPIFNDYEAIVDNGNVAFVNREDTVCCEFESQLLNEGFNWIFGERVLIELSEKQQNTENINKLYTTAYLSSDKIVGSLCVRNRRVGDKIFINGMNKSIKKLFIEKKIPKEYRDIIPIFCDDEGIIYVPFIGISDRVYGNNTDFKQYILSVFETIDTERWSNAYEK